MQNDKNHMWHLASMAELKRLDGEWRVCPSCGKKEYKPYVDMAGEPLARECGRCNREIKCGYHMPPKEWIGQNPGAEVRKVEMKPAVQLKPIYMPLGWVAAKRKDNDKNILLNYLRALPWNNQQAARLEVGILAYGVGTDKAGRTIWWQIDEETRVRSGKQMTYKEDGHRDKSKHPMWIHSVMKSVYPDDKFEYVGCLFGLHLAQMFPQATICIVESEKTALICSAFWPMEERVFMASSGLRGINTARLSYLLRNKREIVAYPDHDGYQLWKEKLAEVDERIKVSDFVEKHWNEGKDSPTADIADILLRIMGETPNPDQLTNQQQFEIMKLKNKYFKELVECLPFEIINPDKIIKS